MQCLRGKGAQCTHESRALRGGVKGGAEWGPQSRPNYRGLGSRAEGLRFDMQEIRSQRGLDFHSILTNTNCFGVALSSFCGTRSAWDTGLFFVM